MRELLIPGLLLGLVLGLWQRERSGDLEAERGGTGAALDGAWELVAAETVAPDGAVYPYETQESFLLFSGKYYSMNWASGDEPAAFYESRFQPTDAEKLARYSSLLVNAGTYRIVDGTLTIRPRFALVPEFVGGLGEFEYEVAGDTLRLAWTKILSADDVPDPWTARGYRYNYTFVRAD